MHKEKVVIVGASGYSGEELVRLLSAHPHADLVAVTSRQAAGQSLSQIYPRFTGTRYASVKFIDSTAEAILASGARIVFLALPHGVAPELAAISVYGLPEIYREQIKTAQLVACPGCYPTSVLLPLIPLLRRSLIKAPTIAVFSMSGVSGAGRNAKVDYLFAECNESVR